MKSLPNSFSHDTVETALPSAAVKSSFHFRCHPQDTKWYLPRNAPLFPLTHPVISSHSETIYFSKKSPVRMFAFFHFFLLPHPETLRFHSFLQTRFSLPFLSKVYLPISDMTAKILRESFLLTVPVSSLALLFSQFFRLPYIALHPQKQPNLPAAAPQLQSLHQTLH